LHMLGLLAHRRGDLAAARALIIRAVEARPDFALAHRDLGIVQQKLGQAGGAAARHPRAPALHGGPVLARVHLAGFLPRPGAAVSAIKLLRAGLKESPDRFELHNNLAFRSWPRTVRARPSRRCAKPSSSPRAWPPFI